MTGKSEITSINNSRALAGSAELATGRNPAAPTEPSARSVVVSTPCYILRIEELDMAHATVSPRQTVSLRIQPETRALIDRAARVLGKNRTDFILEAARAAAEEALLDQCLIAAQPKAYQEFLARLDKKPQPNDALKKTMQTLAPWD
jgi:uncharacterized protein (DUF1778 family)